MPFETTAPLRPPRRDPTLSEVLKTAKRATELGIRVQVPAKVLLFNPATARAKLEVSFLPVRNTTRGEQVSPTPIILESIPVEMPGAQGNYIHFPINPGTTGMMTICDRSLERWSKNSAPADPVLRKLHSLIDGVFRPGARPKSEAIAVDMTGVVIESATILKLGAAATSPAVLGAEFKLALLFFCDTLLGLVGSMVPSVDPSTLEAATALKAALLIPAGAPGAVLSPKVLVE